MDRSKYCKETWKATARPPAILLSHRQAFDELDGETASTCPGLGPRRSGRWMSFRQIPGLTKSCPQITWIIF